MQKVITLRCSECGNQHEFTIGAGANLAGWREIAERIPEKAEAEKLTAMLTKILEKRSKAAVKEFTRNAAEPLHNVAYAACGEEVRKLLTDLSPEEENKILGEKVRETIASSAEKWNAAVQKEGVLAFEAVYLCPKSSHPKQGLHVSVRYKDEKGAAKCYVYKNKCDECSSGLMLADDGNLGFMHEDCVTVARCEKCGGTYAVNSVSFKMPQKDAPTPAQ